MYLPCPASFTKSRLAHPISCPLWCPRQRPLVPRTGSEAAFGALAQLAKATVVHLVFDYARLRHPRLQRCYKQFVNQPEKLAPFRIEHHFSSKGLDRCDWRALDLPDSAPPAYAESFSKRRRPGKDEASTASSIAKLTRASSEPQSRVVVASIPQQKATRRVSKRL